MEKRWKIDLLNFMKMKDTNWIKPHLQRLFNESVTIGEKYSLTFNKIKQFGGKLYKYYSFEDEWSLKNLEGDIIHFSKPQAFNDPFDCALGFSIDRAVEMLLPTIFDKKLNLSNEKPHLIYCIIFARYLSRSSAGKSRPLRKKYRYSTSAKA